MSVPPAPEQKSLVGYTVGRCRLMHVCGRGAMGTVYVGLHAGLDLEVAVKVLPPHLAVNTNLVVRFMREAKLAARLNHVNVVRVYDVGEEAGYYYLVMEYVDGTDALELLRNHGPQPAWVSADIGAGAARALQHAHSNGVVHRDIKPANLMLPVTGGVKVADFGLARALTSDSGLTMAGAVMGTPDYMAPEQAQGEMVGPLADIYSLGATLFHMFVGRAPFQGASPMAVALQHVTNRIKVPEEFIRNDNDRRLAALIHELTSKQAANRPSNLEQIAARLKEIALGRNNTQKLVSEGATLFDTVGVTADDVQAIKLAKAAAATAALEPMGEALLDPELLEWRSREREARPSGGSEGAAQAPGQPESRPASEPPSGPMPAPEDSPAAPPEQLEKLRQAAQRARAKAQGTSAPSIPAAATTSAKGTAGPEKTPPRPANIGQGAPVPKTRTIAEATSGGRRGKDEDESWTEYTAPAFPEFKRDTIMNGTISNRLAEEFHRHGDTASRVGAGMGIDPRPFDSGVRGYVPRRSSSWGRMVPLVVVLAVAVGLFWYFVASGDKDNRQQPVNGTVGAPATLERMMLFPRIGVSALAMDGRAGVIFAGSQDGRIVRLETFASEPTHTEQFQGRIEVLALRPDGSRLAIGTDRGEVYELSGSSLEGTRTYRLENGSVTAIIIPIAGRTVVGDSNGFVRLTTSGSPQQVAAGRPVTMLIWRNNEVWAAAGTNMVRYVLGESGLEPVGRATLPAAIQSVAYAQQAVFVVAGDRLYRLGEDGVEDEGEELQHAFVACTRDAGNVAVYEDRMLVVKYGRSLERRAEVALNRGEFPLSSVHPLPPSQMLVGTSEGTLLRVTIR
jgi:serine/threonine protein kinase